MPSGDGCEPNYGRTGLRRASAAALEQMLAAVEGEELLYSTLISFEND